PQPSPQMGEGANARFATFTVREVEIAKIPFANVGSGFSRETQRFKYIAAKAAPTVVLDKLVRLYFPSP
ncbi:MAG: hypothetical protein KJ675_14840, partial [Gammaproteobacteria bacterium]|nr:hypothetical protein [Gammaproteobacteria bacterium]